MLDRAGFVGADGATHSGSFDLAYLCCLPNVVVMAPSDEAELVKMINTSVHINDRPSAFRYPRGNGTGITMPSINELLEIGYSGKPAAFLRAFKAGYFAILYNFIVMGWVINAMAAVVSVMLNIDKWSAVWLCVIIALVYAILSGFWGVVITDLA